MKLQEKQKIFEEIARNCIPSIETLEERKMDSLDFYEVHVKQIKDAIAEAFAAGQLAS